jgi:hypothetical protein
VPVQHVPEIKLAELALRKGTMLVHVPYHGQLRFGQGECKAYNCFPVTYAQVPPTELEWLDQAIQAHDAQHLGTPIRRLVFDAKAAAQLDLDAFAQDHPSVELVVLDADA